MPELHLLVLDGEFGFAPVADVEEELEGELEEEGDPPNPVLPEVHEILWPAIFFVALWMLMKYVLYPRVRGTMDNRAAKLAEDRDATDLAAAQLGTVQAEYDQALMAARVQASSVIDEARARAEEYRAGIVASAESDIARMKSEAAAEIEAARARALDSLRPQVKSLAVGAASQVLGTPLDEGAQSAAIDAYLDTVD